MKKILALLVVFAFIFTFLVGCNETVDVESGDESVAEQSDESKDLQADSDDESDDASVESEPEELKMSDYFAEVFTGNASSKIYCIDNIEQLYNFVYLVNEKGIDFEGDVVLLRNNIELNPTDDIDDWGNTPPENVWEPIGTKTPFKGRFIGGSEEKVGAFYSYKAELKEISGIYCAGDKNKKTIGLFANIEGAQISNIKLGKGKLYGENEKTFVYAAGIVINAVDSQIIGCVNYADVASAFAAGIVFDAENSEVIWSDNYGSISSENGSSAGIANRIKGGEIYGCVNYGTINGIDAAGIACGQGRSVIRCCVNKGSVTAKCFGGGILGHSSYDSGASVLASCVNYGEILSAEQAGGIIGSVWEEQSSLWVMDVLNVGNVTVAYEEDIITDDYPYPDDQDRFAGGIVGKVVLCSVDGLGDFRLDGALNLGQVTASDDHGAIIGNEGTYGYLVDLCDNCFYLDTTVEKSVIGKAVKKSKLTDEKTLAGLLDGMNWEMDEEVGHPILARDHVSVD
ncbi:MAG: hypothetical protein IKU30_08350 [Clostridia bacterium]|nr:hypothetical protein [Clostridia bacterium]